MIDVGFFYSCDRQPSVREDDLWSLSARTEGRSCAFFYNDPMKDHLQVLSVSPLGRQLVNFMTSRGVDIIKDEALPDNIEAIYEHSRNKRHSGVIKHGKFVHATLMGHEIRHVWQHLAEATKVLVPHSAEEEILQARAFEADARAVEFVVTVQCVNELGVKNPYAHNLLKCLDDYEKEICLYSTRELERIASNKAVLNQSARRVFDRWMTFAPSQRSYDIEIEKTLKLARVDGLTRIWGRVHNWGADPYPHYTQTGVRKEFGAQLAMVLGDQLVNSMGNYLTETKGPALNDPLYTRICNYRLERWAKYHQAKLKAS